MIKLRKLLIEQLDWKEYPGSGGTIVYHAVDEKYRIKCTIGREGNRSTWLARIDSGVGNIINRRLQSKEEAIKLCEDMVRDYPDWRKYWTSAGF